MNESRKVALVTGAGSGVGKASALALARQGYTVVLSGRRREPLEAVVNEGTSRGFEMRAVPADVGSPSSVEALFAEISTSFGRLDLLFNNAGVSAPPIPIEDQSYDQWMNVINTNLGGAFLCTKYAFRLMKGQRPQGGRIVNNGSVSAHMPRPHSAPYTASKHGVTGLTRATALDGRSFDIACGQIDIGNASTDMSAPVAGGVLQADGSTLVEPQMDVENVARAVAYMASLPLNANILFLTVMATKMPFVGRG